MPDPISPAALRKRAEHAIDGPCTVGDLAHALNITAAELRERAHELRGIVEARLVGDEFVLYTRVRKGPWPTSEAIERVVERVRRKKAKRATKHEEHADAAE